MANDSFWAASAKTMPLGANALVGNHNCEVAVVGGGFTGLSTALHLAEAGHSVALAEAGEIGDGASGRNGGQVNPGLKLDAAGAQSRLGEDGLKLYHMAQKAPQFLGDMISRLEIECDFRRQGLVRLAHNDRALASLRAAGQKLADEGVPVRPLHADEVEAIVGTRRYRGGLLDERGASVQPLDLARGLARAAEARGVRVLERTPVVGIKKRGGSWKLATHQGEITARRIVIATNAYTGPIVPGLAQSVLPVNSFQIATAPLPQALSERFLPNFNTVYDSRRLVLYFRRSPQGGVILGGRASFASAQASSGRRADYSVLEHVLHGIFPDLKSVPVIHRWTGLVCVTADFLPHYHEPEPGMHVLLGFNGRGVALSNRAGAWLANRIAGRPDDGWLPQTQIRPIPFHGLREPALNIAMQAHRVLDFFGY